MSYWYTSNSFRLKGNLLYHKVTQIKLWHKKCNVRNILKTQCGINITKISMKFYNTYFHKFLLHGCLFSKNIACFQRLPQFIKIKGNQYQFITINTRIYNHKCMHQGSYVIIILPDGEGSISSVPLHSQSVIRQNLVFSIKGYC